MASAKLKEAVKRIKSTLDRNYETAVTSPTAGPVGSGKLFIGGQVFDGDISGVTQVINVGRPAAAQYAAKHGGSGGTTVVSGGGGTTSVTLSSTPGTLSATTINDAAGSHTHAIDASSAPGATEYLLKSDSTGLLTLPLLAATTSLTTPSLLSTGDLTITPAGGDIFANARLDVITGTSGVTKSASYSGIAVHSASNTGVQLLSPNTGVGLLTFGDTDDNDVGRILYRHSSDRLDFETGGTLRATMGSTYTWDVTGTMRATTSLTTPLLTTAPNTDLLIDPAGTGAVTFGNDQTLRTSSFDSSFPITGWQINEVSGISGYSSLTIGKIQADELAVRVFVADEVRVDRGDEYWTKSYGIVAESFTTPSSIGGTVSVKFEDSPALVGAIFVNNDWVLIRKLDIDTGITLSNIWGQVATYVNNSDGSQNWTFTLRSGPTSESVTKGSLAIDFGASGAALIHLSVIDSAGAPYIKMRKWSGANPYTPSNFTTYIQLGNLSSTGNSYYTPSGYGLYIRSTAAEDQFMVADDNGLQIRGPSISLYNSTTQTILMNNTSGINVREDVWGSWDNRRALQWWPDVSSMSGDPSLSMYTGKVVGGLTADQNFSYIDANPTGNVLAGLSITAFGQGTATDATLYLEGGSQSLTTTPSITMTATDINLIGDTAITGTVSATSASVTGTASARNVYLDADTGTTSAIVRWTTSTGSNTYWQMIGQAHDHATTAQQNDLLLQWYNGSTYTTLLYLDYSSLDVGTRSLKPLATDTYDIGTSALYYNNLYARSLHVDTIVGTPSYSHTHSASEITSGTLDFARMATTWTGALTMDADSAGGNSNYVRWLTQTSTIKAWDLIGRAHDYATTAQQNDLLLTYTDNTTTYIVFQADSGTRVIDFLNTPTVGSTAVSLSGHTHDDRYYTETEVNSLLTGYVPTTRTVSAGSGMTGGGALSANITISHADTSTQTSVDNSGTTFIQDITLDAYGHVTAIGSADIGTALDSRYVNISGDTMTGMLTLSNSTDEMARLDSTSATGSPFLSFSQTGTRRSFIQHNDSSDTFIIASEYGPISLRPGAGSTESETLQVHTSGATVTGSLTASTSVITPTVTTASGNLAVTSAGGTVAVTGALTGSSTGVFTGALTAASNTDANNTFGRAIIGYAQASDTATFSHFDHNSSTNFALAQNASGASFINGASGQTVDLQIAGVSQWSVNASRINPRSSVAVDIGDYNRRVRSLYAAELQVETLVAQNVMATIGGRIIVAPTVKLIADLANTGTATSFNTNLQSWWALDEASGTRNDSRGSNSLTSVNSVASTTGKQSSAASFTGASSMKLNRADNTSLSVGDIDFAFCAWVYPTLNSGTRQTIICKGSTATLEYKLDIDWSASGAVKWAVWNSSGTSTEVTGGVVTVNAWHFIVVYHDSGGNAIGVAVNGAETNTSHTTGVRDSTGNFTLGARDTDQFFTGRIDEVGYWKNYIPDAHNRLWLYNRGNGRTYGEVNTQVSSTIDVDGNSLAANDFAYMSAAPSGIAQIEAMRVYSSPSTISGGYRYTVIRNYDGTGLNNWYTGDAVVNLGGNAGEGYIDLTSTSTIHSHFGPTIAIYQRTGNTVWNETTPTVAMGNLRSFVDYASDKSGLAIGNDLTLTPATGFQGLTADATNGLRLFNTDIQLNDSGTLRAEFTYDSGINLRCDTSNTTRKQQITWWRDMTNQAGNPAGVVDCYYDANGNNMRMFTFGNSVGATIDMFASGGTGSGGATLRIYDTVADPSVILLSATTIRSTGDLDMNANDIIDVGALGVGTSSPAYKAHIVGPSAKSTTATNTIGGFGSNDTPGASDLVLYVRVGGNSTAGSRFVGIGSYENGTGARTLSLQELGGNTAVGSTSASYTLDVNGQAHASSFPTSSDARFKDIIAPIIGALDKVTALNAYTFHWKQNYAAYKEFLNADGTPQTQVGFIAQEVEQLFPELITRWKHTGRDGKVTADAYSVDYARMVPILVQAIRELKKQVEELTHAN